MWHALIANFAVFGLCIFGWLQAQELLARLRRPYRRAVFGALMGLGAVASMLLTTEVQPGVFFDLRSSFVAIAAFLGGPIGGTITAVLAAGYRLPLGGIGTTGALLSIGIVAATGLSANAWIGRRTAGIAEILAVSLATAIGGVAGLLLLPEATRSVASGTMLPMVVLGFAATAGGAFSIAQSRRRLEERKLLLAAIAQAPDYLYVKDRDSRFVAVNNRVAAESGLSPSDLYGKSDFDIASPQRARDLFEAEQKVIADGTAIVNHEELIADASGEPRWFLTSKAAVRNIDGEILGLAGVTRDISERKALERKLADAHGQLEVVLTEMSDGLAHFDAGGRLQFSNDQYRAMFPLTGRMRVAGVHLSDILRAAADTGEQLHIPPGRREAFVTAVMASLAVGGTEEVPLFDGSWLHIRTRPTHDGGATVVVSDITNLKRAEAGLVALTEQLRSMATTDALTGLVNRRGFDEQLAEEIRRANRTRQPISLIMVDIDRFKAYNDRYGHQAGDECLKTVATALRAGARRPADVVARYGGEEICLILPDTDHQGAYQLAEQLRLAVRSLGISHAGSEKGLVTISLGVASVAAETTGGSMAELIRQADSALYVAKDAGRDRVMGWGERHAARA